MKTEKIKFKRKKEDMVKMLIMMTLFIMVSFTLSSQVMMRGGPSTEPYKEKENDKTLSPYFFVYSEDSETDQLPLKSTSADIDIAGVIADVKVTQVYKNDGKNVLEAIYIFPASTRAAVYGMKMTIGERTIVAKIKEKEQAREDYEQAKADGKTASLLEEQRPNVFQMSVANILPGDEIIVELSYTELIVPEKGLYEFVYPTVVGPRYSNMPEEKAPAGEHWVENPYTHEGDKPLYAFNLDLNLASAITIKDIGSSSHDVEVSYNSKKSAEVHLSGSDKGNKDFILQYRLAGDRIESGLLLFEGDEENFFLAMIQPPKHVTPENIPPREYIFIVDVSGSMYGFPLDVSKKLLDDLIGSLRPEDRFNVLMFAGGSKVLAEASLPATADNIVKALNMIDNEQGGGGTEVLPAIQRALAMKGTENFSRTFVIVTDGYVTVEREVFDLIRKNLGNANFFSFGIGSSVNRYIIEGIAEAGLGIPFIITDQSEAKTKAKAFREYIQFPVLTNIEMNFEGFDVYDLQPSNVPDLLAERPVVVYGKYRGNPGGGIELQGLTGTTCYKTTLDVTKVKAEKENSALKYLWAREKIRILDDYAFIDPSDNRNDNRVTELGLQYNLLTRFTSFIAIDSQVRNEGGEQSTVKQALPLPEGVSDYAVGGVAATGYNGGNTYMYSGSQRGGSLKGAFRKVFGGGHTQAEVESVEAYEYVPVLDDDTKKEDVLLMVSDMPDFMGNGLKLEEFLKKNLQYPLSASVQNIEGVVYLEFVVEADGSISNVKVVRGLGYGCDEEAVRLIELTDGMWNPGKDRGTAVRVQMTALIRFNLEEE